MSIPASDTCKIKGTGKNLLPVPFVKVLVQRLTTEVTSATAASSATTAATAAIIAGVTARSVETSSATTAAAACWTVFARTSLVDGQRPSVEIFSVEGCDRGLRFRITAHRDECEPA